MILSRLVVTFFLLFGFAANSAEDFLSIPQGIDEQTQLLLDLREDIPWLFEEGAEYDIDFFSFLAKNRQLVEYLKQSNQFVAAAKSEKPPRQFTIRLLETQRTAARRVFSEGRRPELTKKVIAYAEQILLAGQSLQTFWNEFNAEFVTIRTADPRAALTGLTSVLSATERQKILSQRTINEALSQAKKVRFDESAVSLNFDFSRYPLGHQAQRTSRTVLDWIETAIANEENILARLLALQILVKHSQNQNVAMVRYARLNRSVNAREVVETSLGSLLDSPTLSAQLTQTIQAFSQTQIPILNRQDKDVWVRVVDRVFEKVRISQPQEEAVPQETAKYTMVEVRGLRAALRGLVGGDCSSSDCFGWSYLPNEDTFYILDANEQLLGYAMLTKLVSYSPLDPKKKKATWYLHDITGNRISPKTLNLLIHGLSKVAQKEDAVLVLPTAERIHSNNNHGELIALMQRMVALGDERLLEFNDIMLRDVFVASGVRFSADYDLPEQNVTAFVPDFDEELLIKLYADVEPARGRTQRRNSLKTSDAIVIGLDLLHSQHSTLSRNALALTVQRIQANGIDANNIDYGHRYRAAQFIAQQKGINFQALFNLSRTLGNPSQLDLKRYYEYLKVNFESLGIADWTKLTDSHPYLFYEGHLNASDSITTSDPILREKSSNYALMVLRRWDDMTLLKSLLSEDAEILSRASQYQKVVRQLIRSGESGLKKLALIWKMDSPMDFLTPDDLKEIRAQMQDIDDQGLYKKLEKLLDKKDRNACVDTFAS